GSRRRHLPLRRRPRTPYLRRCRLLPDAVALRAVRTGADDRTTLRHATDRPHDRRSRRHRRGWQNRLPLRRPGARCPRRRRLARTRVERTASALHAPRPLLGLVRTVVRDALPGRDRRRLRLTERREITSFFCSIAPRFAGIAPVPATNSQVTRVRVAPVTGPAVLLVLCGNSSVGRASRCQREGRRFEPGFPLSFGPVAKLVRQGTANPSFSGSNPLGASRRTRCATAVFLLARARWSHARRGSCRLVACTARHARSANTGTATPGRSGRSLCQAFG